MLFCKPAKKQTSNNGCFMQKFIETFHKEKANKMKVHFVWDNVPKLFGWFESEIELGYQDHSPRCYKHLLSLSIYDPFSESYCTKWDFHDVDKENWHFFSQTLDEMIGNVFASTRGHNNRKYSGMSFLSRSPDPLDNKDLVDWIESQ